MTNRNVAWVDTESLGLDPDLHPVWEVAVITEADGARLWQLAVTAEDVANADPFAMEMTRFNERYVNPSADLMDLVLREIAEAIGDRHIVGAVPSFDEERLRRLMRKHGVKPGWHYHLCDFENLIVGYLQGRQSVFVEVLQEIQNSVNVPGLTSFTGFRPWTPPWDSTELSRAIGVDPPSGADRHTAMGDAWWARAVWNRIMGGT